MPGGLIFSRAREFYANFWLLSCGYILKFKDAEPFGNKEYLYPFVED